MEKTGYIPNLKLFPDIYLTMPLRRSKFQGQIETTFFNLVEFQCKIYTNLAIYKRDT